MRELAYLNRGLKISIIDKTGSKPKEFINKYNGGIDEFVEFLDNKKEKLLNKNENVLFRKPISITGKKGDVIVESSISGMRVIQKMCLPLLITFFKKMVEHIY